MKGDYSRKTFDPSENYAGVHMQQGRVQLDADWNEQADIRDRRVRAQTVDLHGRCLCSKETPDAFLIENDAGSLTIGRGRLYVDGLLAENHGAAPLAFDNVLAEQDGTEVVAFVDQPYLPTAADLLPDDPGTVLVYLDVWYRHVTYLEEPDLIEVAVGVDTTTRQQAVWQVKLLDGVGSITCETPDDSVPGWLDVITPSGARLSWEAVGVAAPTDPCRIPPSAGYRALENRLYRVEIHDGGAPGPATFKWSRHNGTVASRVTAIPELDTLGVDSTGRDDVLRFNAGDWVEITDDHLELAGEPGIIRRIDSVNDGTRTITLRDDLPGGVFPTDAQGLTTPSRHTRVRRWDQSGVVRDTLDNVIVDLDDPASTGVIPVPADGTSIVLEDGVQITFGSDSAGGPARSGDYWCFAARAGQPDLDDERSDQPPQGIHHHYCRLAVAEYDGESFTGTPTDCRHPPAEPGVGCCTVVVQPGEDLQAAIDSLPDEGGCVCVKTGLHSVTDALRIEISNVHLHGESAGATIRRENGAPVLQIASPTGAMLDRVDVEQLRLETVAGGTVPGGAAIVTTDRCTNLRIRDCVAAADELTFIAGIRIGSTLGESIERCEITRVAYGVWVDTDSTALAIVDNAISAESIEGDDAGVIGIWMEDAFDESRIERNVITDFISGIYLNSQGFEDPPSSGASETVIAGNRVDRRTSGGDAGAQRIFGIDVAAWNCLVRDNVVDYRSPAYGGIRMTGSGGRIEKNLLRSAFFADAAAEPPIGIQIGFVSEALTFGPNDATVSYNRLLGRQDAIVVLAGADTEIFGNGIEAEESEVRNAIVLDSTSNARLERNRIVAAEFGITLRDGEGNRIVGNEIRSGGAGIAVTNETRLEVANNRLEELRGTGIVATTLQGTSAFVENVLRSCGYEGPAAMSLGIAVAFGDVLIESCTVQNTGVSADGAQVATPAFGVVGLFLLQCRVQGNLVGYGELGTGRDPLAEDRALVLAGLLELTTADTTLGFPVQILDNSFSGPGLSHLVELLEARITDTLVLRFERVTFSNNDLMHLTGQSSEVNAIVSLVGRRAIVMGNHFNSLSFRPSVDFNNMSGTYIGNDHVAAPVNYTPFPTALGDFNR